MKRKLLAVLLAIACAFCLALGLTACADNDGGDKNNTEQGGDNTNPGGGDNTNPGGGDNTNPGGGDNTNPGGGDNTNPGGGDNTNPGGGDNTNPGGGDNTNPGGGDNTNPGGGDNTNPGGYTETPPVDGEDEYTFTVTLYETNGKGENSRFYPQSGQTIEVMWSGESSIATATVDPTGVASKKGLDGDFRVTLSKLPMDANGNPTHTYNPNGITADNNNRNISIILIPIRTANGTGNSNSTKINITTEGAYKAHFSGEQVRKYGTSTNLRFPVYTP